MSEGDNYEEDSCVVRDPAAEQDSLLHSSALPSSSLSTMSVMRRALAREMDLYEHKNKKENIVLRRGAFKWLPVYFSNDLIHGSW